VDTEYSSGAENGSAGAIRQRLLLEGAAGARVHRGAGGGSREGGSVRRFLSVLNELPGLPSRESDGVRWHYGMTGNCFFLSAGGGEPRGRNRWSLAKREKSVFCVVVTEQPHPRIHRRKLSFSSFLRGVTRWRYLRSAGSDVGPASS